MAEVIDETPEQRRQREEDEALAEIQRLQQVDVAPPESRLPQEAIPASNTSFTNDANGGIQIDLPEGYAPPFNREMVGDQQYQNEVARARAGSGFIQGYGDTPTYDPAIAEAAQHREQDRLAAQAERFAGVQAYQACIKAGGKPEECIALHGPKMFGGNPQGLVNLVTRREPPAKVAPLPKFVPGVVTADAQERLDQLHKAAASERKLLEKGFQEVWDDTKGEMVKVPLSLVEKAQQRIKIADLEKQANEVLAPGGHLREEFNKRIDQGPGGFNRARWDAADIPRATVQAAPSKAETAAAPAKAQETVIVVKEGRRYSLPKSQLDEALKTGYQLGR